MATLTTTATLPQLEATTRAAILKRVLREGAFGDYGTATGGASDGSTLIDTTNLKSTQLPAGNWVGAWLRMTSGSNAASVSVVTAYDPALGKLTVNPVFSAAVANGDTYEIWRYPRPKLVLDVLDTLLTQELAWYWMTPLSEVADYDMEQNNVTDWTASNANVTKATLDPQMGGTRYLSVAATSANGYARSNLINVEPNTAFHISALTRASASATTSKIVVYDETNGAAINLTTGTATSARLYNHRLWGNFITPATCYQISIRLTTVENAKTTYWNQVVLFNQTARDIALPWWVKRAQQVLGVFTLDPRSVAPTSQNVWDQALIGWREGDFDTHPNNFGKGQLRLTSRKGPIGSRPLFIIGKRFETAYASDSDTKHVDENHLVAAVLAKLYDLLSRQPNTGMWDSDWIRQAAVEWQAKFEEEERYQAEQIQQLMKAPPDDVAVFAPTSQLGYRMLGRR